MNNEIGTESIKNMEYECLFLTREYLLQYQKYISFVHGDSSRIVAYLLEFLNNNI